MKRHEYRNSAILAFAAAALFAIAGLVIHIVVIRPMITEDSSGFETLLFNAIPTALYTLGLMFAIIGAFSMANEISIEKGEDIVADITGIKEYFYGKGTDVHYNLFCQWKCPYNGRMYRYMVKNIPYNPESRFPDKKINMRVSRNNPRLHFIDF